MMKNLKFIHIIVVLFWGYASFAQIEVFESEVKERNGIVYYHNQALTGILYSDDDFRVPNECECTLKAHYKNGLLHGKYMRWNTQGELLYERNYLNGKLNGEAKYYKNNQLVKKEIYKQGQLQKELLYQNGKLTLEHFIYPLTNEEVIVKYEGDFRIEEKRKDGRLYEINKYKGEVLAEKIQVDKNGVRKVVKDEKLLFYKDLFTGKQAYYLLKFKNFTAGAELKQKILEFIKKRTSVVNNDNLIAEKKYDYVLTFTLKDNQNLLVSLADAQEQNIKEYSAEIYQNSDLNSILTNNKNSGKVISLDVLLADIFPVYAYVSQIRSQKDNQIYSVNIDKGSKQGIRKQKYYLYDEDKGITMSELKVVKIYSNKTYCKVISYRVWLNDYMQNHSKVMVMEKELK